MSTLPALLPAAKRHAPVVSPLPAATVTLVPREARPAPRRRRRARVSLERLIVNTERSLRGNRWDGVAVRELLDPLGDRAHGPVLLAMGLVCLSPLAVIPGVNWTCALGALLVALQLVFARRIWLPAFLLRLRLPRRTLRRSLRACTPAGRMIDRMSKPRWRWLARSPFNSAAGLLCAFAAVLSFPLALLPFAPLAPSLAIALFGLGLTVRDGLAVTLAALVTALTAAAALSPFLALKLL